MVAERRASVVLIFFVYFQEQSIDPRRSLCSIDILRKLVTLIYSNEQTCQGLPRPITQTELFACAWDIP